MNTLSLSKACLKEAALVLRQNGKSKYFDRWMGRPHGVRAAALIEVAKRNGQLINRWRQDGMPITIEKAGRYVDSETGHIVDVEEGVVIGRPLYLGDNICLGSHASIGDAVYIGEGSSIGKYAKIGDGVNLGVGVRVENGAVVSQRAYVGDYCIVGNSAEVGEGAFISHGSQIGQDARVGALVKLEPFSVVRNRSIMPNSETTASMRESLIDGYRVTGDYIMYKWVTPDRKSPFIWEDTYTFRDDTIVESMNGYGIQVLRPGYKPEWVGFSSAGLIPIRVIISGEDVISAGNPFDDAVLRVRRLRVLE